MSYIKRAGLYFLVDMILISAVTGFTAMVGGNPLWSVLGGFGGIIVARLAIITAKMDARE